MTILYLVCALLSMAMLLQNTYDDKHRIPGRTRFWFAVWALIPVFNLLFLALVLWQLVVILSSKT